MSTPLYALIERAERMDSVYSERYASFSSEQDRRAKQCIAEAREAIEEQQKLCERRRRQAIATIGQRP
jgi:hypothetical protein